MPSFKNGDVEIAYLDEGEGDPIVLVHGFASNKETNWAMPGWTATLRRDGRLLAGIPVAGLEVARRRQGKFLQRPGAKTKRGKSGRRRCQEKISERAAAKTDHPYGHTGGRGSGSARLSARPLRQQNVKGSFCNGSLQKRNGVPGRIVFARGRCENVG